MNTKDISKVIYDAINFVNGWKVSDETFNEKCLQAAKKIHKSFQRRERKNI